MNILEEFWYGNVTYKEHTASSSIHLHIDTSKGIYRGLSSSEETDPCIYTYTCAYYSTYCSHRLFQDCRNK